MFTKNKMAITLESVAPPGLDQEAVEEEEIVEPAETAEVAAEVEAETEDQEPTEEIATEEPPVEVPVPKARGRPKKRIQPQRLLRKLPQKLLLQNPKPKRVPRLLRKSLRPSTNRVLNRTRP